MYFAKDGAISVSTYASPTASTSWKNAENGIVKVMALCESEYLILVMRVAWTLGCFDVVADFVSGGLSC